MYSRDKYIANMRAVLTCFLRLDDLSSAGLIPQNSQTACSMFNKLVLLALPIANRSPNSVLAISGVILQSRERPTACKRLMATRDHADISRQTFDNQLQNRYRKPQISAAAHLLSNFQTAFDVGIFEWASQPGSQTRAQIGTQMSQLQRWAIGRDDDLFSRTYQVINRVLELTDRGTLAGKKLNAIDHQQIQIAILAAEHGQTRSSQRAEELAGELFGGQIDAAAEF